MALILLATGMAVSLGLAGSAAGKAAKAGHGKLTWSLTHPVGVDGKYPVSATFRPIRKGAVVSFQRLVSGKWRTVATTRESATGVAKANIAAGSATSKGWRAVAKAPKKGKLAALTITSPVVRPKVATAPAWSDDFSGTSLNAAKWTQRLSGQRIAGRLCSVSDPRAATVSGGSLALKVLPDTAPAHKPSGVLPCWSGAAGKETYFLNGHIGTTTSFTRGVFAARIRFQAAQGAHGAFWLQSMAPAGSRGTEIDTVEYFGDKRPDSGIQQNVYGDASTDVASAASMRNTKLKQVFSATRRPSNGWHVYSVEWTKSEYVFRIDGVVTFRTAKPYVSAAPEQVVLSLLSSDWERDKLDPATLGTSAVMRVDWVRIWK